MLLTAMRPFLKLGWGTPAAGQLQRTTTWFGQVALHHGQVSTALPLDSPSHHLWASIINILLSDITACSMVTKPSYMRFTHSASIQCLFSTRLPLVTYLIKLGISKESGRALPSGGSQFVWLDC